MRARFAFVIARCSVESSVDDVSSAAVDEGARNSTDALGVISALAARGYDVPGDVSVVGCDDVPMAAMTSPALTTIHMPVQEVGARAIELLHGQRRAEGVAAEFVIRGSTGPATR